MGRPFCPRWSRYRQCEMLLTIESQPWFSYGWWADIGMPGLAGVGGSVVGVGAIVVAARTHSLAKQVRRDEQDRDRDAARKRYREQLFRTVEPAISAILDHALQVDAGGTTSPSAGSRLVTDVMARLHVLSVVPSAEDREFVEATIDVYGVALSKRDVHTKSDLLTALALGLARLLDEDRDVAALVRKAKTLTGTDED